jgi:hypothetical protein
MKHALASLNENLDKVWAHLPRGSGGEVSMYLNNARADIETIKKLASRPAGILRACVAVWLHDLAWRIWL